MKTHNLFKKLIVSLAIISTCLFTGLAQTEINVPLPKLDGQVFYLIDNNNYKNLIREPCTPHPSRSGLCMNLLIYGAHSPNVIEPKDETVRFIIYSSLKKLDPESFIKVLNLEKKSKKRKVQISGTSVFTGEISKLSEYSLPYAIEVIGENCYMLTLDRSQFQSGNEYCIVSRILHTLDGSEQFAIATFSIK